MYDVHPTFYAVDLPWCSHALALVCSVRARFDPASCQRIWQESRVENRTAELGKVIDG